MVHSTEPAAWGQRGGKVQSPPNRGASSKSGTRTVVPPSRGSLRGALREGYSFLTKGWPRKKRRPVHRGHVGPVRKRTARGSPDSDPRWPPGLARRCGGSGSQGPLCSVQVCPPVAGLVPILASKSVVLPPLRFSVSMLRCVEPCALKTLSVCLDVRSLNKAWPALFDSEI